MRVAYAPSKVRWFFSRGLHHLPLIKRFVERKEIKRLVELARDSAEREQNFRILDSGWARKTVPFNTKNVLTQLERIDVANDNYILPDVVQSKHFSRIYEYPYAVYHLRDVKKNGRIIDCGCGTTSFQFYLAEQGFEVHAVDDWLPCLWRVAAIKKQSGLTKLNPTFGSIFKIPFEDSYFDGATCISVIEHALTSFESSNVMLKGAINEMLRALRKGAPLVLTFDVNFGNGHRHLLPSEYSELCDILRIKTTPLPGDRLYSSDTEEGSLMGENIAVYSITLAKA